MLYASSAGGRQRRAASGRGKKEAAIPQHRQRDGLRILRCADAAEPHMRRRVPRIPHDRRHLPEHPGHGCGAKALTGLDAEIFAQRPATGPKGHRDDTTIGRERRAAALLETRTSKEYRTRAARAIAIGASPDRFAIGVAKRAIASGQNVPGNAPPSTSTFWPTR